MLTGTRALVTGATAGIGAAVVAGLAEQGAQVIAGHRSEDDRRRAQDLGNVTHVVGDLTSASLCRQLVDETVERLGGIDLLVNNAAVTGPPALQPLTELDEGHVDHVLAVNLRAPLLLSSAASRHMKLAGHGIILSVSSVGAHVAQRHAATYCASKAGVESLTRSLALELGPDGIRAVAIAFGPVRTEHADEMAAAVATAHARDGHSAPDADAESGFVYATPTAAARVVLAMLASELDLMNGTTVTADGGYPIPGRG